MMVRHKKNKLRRNQLIKNKIKDIKNRIKK